MNLTGIANILVITLHSLPNKVLDFRTDIGRHGVAAPHDPLRDLLLCVLLAFHRERGGSCQQLVRQHADRPPIDRLERMENGFSFSGI